MWLYERGFGLVNGFIDHLYSRLGNTSNYSATANLHNSHITIAPAKPFQPAVSSSAIPWQRLLTVEILQLHALRSYLHSLPCRTAKQLTLSLAYNILDGPRRNTPFRTITLRLRSYSLQREGVYRAVAQKLSLFTELCLSNGSIRHNMFNSVFYKTV
jgi:hypothetical protein